MRLKQQAMTDVSVADGEKPTSIREHLINVYGNATVGASPVREWVRRIKEAKTGDVSCSCVLLICTNIWYE